MKCPMCLRNISDHPLDCKCPQWCKEYVEKQQHTIDFQAGLLREIRERLDIEALKASNVDEEELWFNIEQAAAIASRKEGE